MKALLLSMLFLIFSCDIFKEPDCTGLSGGDAVRDECGICGGDGVDGGEAILWGEYYDIATTDSLILQYQGIIGLLIPPAIGCLTNLTHLRLADNQLTEEIPQGVCDLIESNNLNMSNILSGNNLTNTCE